MTARGGSAVLGWPHSFDSIPRDHLQEVGVRPLWQKAFGPVTTSIHTCEEPHSEDGVSQQSLTP